MKNKDIQKAVPAELSEEDLGAVAGGAGVVTMYSSSLEHSCSHFVCAHCGMAMDAQNVRTHGCKAKGHGQICSPPDSLVQTRVNATISNNCQNCRYFYLEACIYGE